MTNTFDEQPNSPQPDGQGEESASQEPTNSEASKPKNGRWDRLEVKGPEALRNFLSRVVPWPANDEPGYINLHWHLPGKPFLGRAFRGIDDFIGLANKFVATGKKSNLYFCLSLQAKAEDFGSHLNAVRDSQNALAFRSIWLDIDIKSKGYPTIEAAIEALFDFIQHYNLPPPSAIVLSGGGMHIYWFSNRPLSYAEWHPYAEGLKAAALQWGLRCDAGLMANGACVLRIPGTLNFKTNPPKPVRLYQLMAQDVDFSKVFAPLKEIAPARKAASAKAANPGLPFNGAKVSAAFAHLKPDKRLGEGIEDYPPLPFAAIKEGCAWLREAHETGGKEHDQPQWHLAVLAATFMEDGNTLAHAFGNQHPDYTREETEQKWDEKIRARAANPKLGWPSCKAIQDAGSKHCKTCPHLALEKSPLNLGLPAAPPESPPAAPLPTWDPAGLKASFTNVPHRPWVYGTYLIRGEVTVVASPGGVGKTALTIGAAIEIATGTELLGETIWGTDLKVLSINREDSKTEVERRVWAFSLSHQLASHPPERLYVVGSDDPRVKRMSFLQVNKKSTPTLNDDGFAALAAALDGTRPDVLILDPLIMFCGGGSTSDNATMALVLAELKLLAVAYKCAVLVVHHTRKGGEPGDAESVSGAAAIVNLARRTLMPVSMTSQEAGEAGVLPSGRGQYFRLVDAKSNFAPKLADSPWYALRNIELPNPEPPLYPHGDNVQAVVRVTLPLPRTASEAANDQKIQKAILDLVDHGKSIDGERYPYSPSGKGGRNERAIIDDAMAAVRDATAPRQWPHRDLQVVVHAAIDKMMGDGWIYKDELKGRRRFRQGSALYVRWQHTPWPGQPGEK